MTVKKIRLPGLKGGNTFVYIDDVKAYLQNGGAGVVVYERLHFSRLMETCRNGAAVVASSKLGQQGVKASDLWYHDLAVVALESVEGAQSFVFDGRRIPAL